MLRALSIVVRPGRIDLAALLTGLAALAILALLSRTRFAQAGLVLAVVVPTAAVAAAGANGVARVRDTGHILPGIPLPVLPDFRLLSYGMISGALAVASGIWMGIILAAFSGAVGEVAVPTLAAVLIFFGLSTFQAGQIRTIWRTGPGSQVAIIATFVATLLVATLGVRPVAPGRLP